MIDKFPIVMCPFCGAEQRFPPLYQYSNYIVDKQLAAQYTCSGCGAKGPVVRNRPSLDVAVNDAIMGWNLCGQLLNHKLSHDKSSDIIVVTNGIDDDFETNVNELLNSGYKLMSSYCKIINRKKHGTYTVWTAIMIKSADAFT